MPNAGHFLCPLCRRVTEMVTVKRASEIVGVSRATVYLWQRQHKIHGQKIASGQLRICYNSLFDSSYPIDTEIMATSTPKVNLAVSLIQEQYKDPGLTLSIIAKQLG